MNIKKITVVGLGYVELAQALLFNDAFNVVGFDTNKDVVENLRKGILHIKDGDNTRESSIIDVVKLLKIHNVKIIIYEPLLENNTFENIEIIKNLGTFKNKSDLIITNRMHSELNDVARKVFTRDFYCRDQAK